MATTNKQQVAALLKAIIGKGVETKDAVPTIKKLIEAKIFALKDLSADNMPSSIDPEIQQKLLPKKRKSRGQASPSKKKSKKVSFGETTSGSQICFTTFRFINGRI